MADPSAQPWAEVPHDRGQQPTGQRRGEGDRRGAAERGQPTEGRVGLAERQPDPGEPAVGKAVAQGLLDHPGERDDAGADPRDRTTALKEGGGRREQRDEERLAYREAGPRDDADDDAGPAEGVSEEDQARDQAEEEPGAGPSAAGREGEQGHPDGSQDPDIVTRKRRAERHPGEQGEPQADHERHAATVTAAAPRGMRARCRRAQTVSGRGPPASAGNRDGPDRRWDQHLAGGMPVGCCCLLGGTGRHSVHQSAMRAQFMAHSASLAWSAAARASRRRTPFRTTPRASRLTVQVNHRAISYSGHTGCQPAVHLRKRAFVQVSATSPLTANRVHLQTFSARSACRTTTRRRHSVRRLTTREGRPPPAGRTAHATCSGSLR